MLVELLRAREPGGDKPGGDGGAGGGVFGARATGGWGERGGGVTAWAGRRGNDPAPALGLPSNVIDLRNHFHATPLHRAAAKGHAEVGGCVGWLKLAWRWLCHLYAHML